MTFDEQLKQFAPEDRADIVERAAIHEFDGHAPRWWAEEEAIKQFDYRRRHQQKELL